ncbi:MAG: response regulator [Clostridiales bacterium]|nr:response regulator [Clostridiales bacterium]
MNILLVDDNRYVLEGLEAGIDFHAVGIDGIFKAQSMRQAIELLGREEVSLVLTDIEMPGGSGLQLLEWINQNRPEIVTLFCTSFANFDYAKKALELHSFDYYLKPIRYDQLQDLLEKAAAEVRLREKEREMKQYGDYWMKSLDRRKRNFWAEVLLRFVDYDPEETLALAKDSHLPYRPRDCFTLVLLGFEKDDSKIEGFSESLEWFTMNNLIGELLAATGIRVEALLKCRKNTLLMVLFHDVSVSKAQLQEVLCLMCCRLQHVLCCSMKCFYHCRAEFLHVRAEYLVLEEAYQSRDSYKEQVVDAGTVPLAADPSDLTGNRKKEKEAVARVRCYIEEHFSEDISREDLCEVVYLSAGYLAQIFKKETGVSLGNYLIDRRIDRAKTLLREGEMTVSQVATAVGYDNFAYFSRLIRKKTGKSPREYQKT